MADFEVERTGEVIEPTHSLTFDEKVLKKIAGISVNEVPGLLAMSGNFIAGITDMLKSSDDPTKGISVEITNNQVSISMRVICEYGRNVPAIFQDVVNKITSAVKEMTGLDVTDVKVHVYDVLTKDDFERQSKKKSDEKPDDKPEEVLGEVVS